MHLPGEAAHVWLGKQAASHSWVTGFGELISQEAVADYLCQLPNTETNFSHSHWIRGSARASSWARSCLRWEQHCPGMGEQCCLPWTLSSPSKLPRSTPVTANSSNCDPGTCLIRAGQSQLIPPSTSHPCIQWHSGVCSHKQPQGLGTVLVYVVCFAFVWVLLLKQKDLSHRGLKSLSEHLSEQLWQTSGAEPKSPNSQSWSWTWDVFPHLSPEPSVRSSWLCH